MNQQPITIWYRSVENVFEFNHISDDWDENAQAPVARSAQQEKSWRGALWQPVKGYMVNGQVVHDGPSPVRSERAAALTSS